MHTKASKAELKKTYINRELSWLAFNRRVLEMACMDAQPLLERMRYLAIVSSNLDEFFEIRVAGLIQQMESGVTSGGIDGLSPRQQLERIRREATALMADQYACWHQQLVPALGRSGIHFKDRRDLSRAELSWAHNYFETRVYPVLTPLGIDPAHPFPQLPNKSLNILVALKPPQESRSGAGKRKRTEKDCDERLAVIPVPRILPRVVPLQPHGAEAKSYLFLSDLIKLFHETLFPGYQIRGAWAFRITRNSDLYIDEEEVTNLLATIEEELHKMRRGDPVRLEIESDVDPALLQQLLKLIDLPGQDVFPIDGPINLMRLMSLYGLIERPDLKNKNFQPLVPRGLEQPERIFQTVRAQDWLLHHPFDSYTPVVDFLNQAAVDPDVLAIKLTLYRTSGDSPIIEALKQASIRGKQVTAVIELKARFDEANNIQWARELEETGVHVVYGLVGLKTHCKCLLVVRQEAGKLVRYAHLGTGNYNPKTARLYTDMSLLTSRESLTREVADLFNTLTGFSHRPVFRKLLVAPFNLHGTIQRLIKREARHARTGKPARIFGKFNSLIDKTTIDNLYRASCAGVKIDLVVRGICSLVPGVPGLSENIQVHSILGQYLEHSRIYYFENDGQPKLFMGSSDWMSRNFFRRVECVFPVEQTALRTYLIDTLIPTYMNDTTAWKLMADGSYQPPAARKGTAGFSAQEHFQNLANEARERHKPGVGKTSTHRIRLPGSV